MDTITERIAAAPELCWPVQVVVHPERESKYP